MKKKSICVIVNKYPNSVEPNTCVFIQQLVWSFADMGYECCVLCPMPINFNREYIKFPEKRIETNENGREIVIYHPKYLSAGQSGKICQKLRVAITTFLYERAVISVLKKKDKKPDVLYAHFLCPAGIVAARVGRKYQIPAYMACGEATYTGNIKYGNKKLKKELTELTGVIAVSSQNKDYMVDNEIVKEEIIEIFPNGYRKERFFMRDKQEARKRFGWDENAFIVGMCGSFDDRKGVLRLQEAVEQIPDVYFACAGKGNRMPISQKCLLAKPINNEDLPWFYSALDIFVLPTRNEGCCNAIVEAIACGCPIISSDRSFNYDICDSHNSILLDPDSVEQIKNAIVFLKEEPERRVTLSNGSLEKAKDLTLKQRADRIAAFMNL